MINVHGMFGCGDGICGGMSGLGFDLMEMAKKAMDTVTNTVTGQTGTGSGDFPDVQTKQAFDAGIAAGGHPVWVPELNRYVAQRPAGGQQAGEAMPFPDINADEYTKLMARGTSVSPIAAALTAYYRYWQATGGTKPADTKKSGGILGSISSIFGGGGGGGGGNDAAAAAMASQPVTPTKKGSSVLPYLLLLAGGAYAAKQAKLI